MLTWLMREAWPSPVTGTSFTQGVVVAGQSVAVSAESDQLVAFGDGIESDAVTLSWGQLVQVGLAATTLRLVTGK
ncbi:MAG TPA: hypothetical protein VMR14_17495 [Streptosporangiaceae bacterium]|nr:hypothetical protein [Streptosporangiaceae bacterium]